jgi:hypothetical protein
MIRPNPGRPAGIMWGSFSHADGEGRFPADLLWSNASCVRRVQAHHLSPVFRAVAGRHLHVCDMTTENVGSALRELHAAGIRDGFVKTRAKGSTLRFAMGEDPARLLRDMDDEDRSWGWLIVQNEGAAAALIVQEAFLPTFEYRMMVVGRAVACGAGCIESMTPVDNEGQRLDDRMETVRSDGVLVRRPDLVARYEDFAIRFADAWADEQGDDTAYSLDLSIDARTGEVVPIELNPMANLGLYANHADLLVEALIAQAPVR